MTPGLEALAEAMRLEQARIYGQLQPEHREPRIPAVVEPAVVVDLNSRRRRRSA